VLDDACGMTQQVRQRKTDDHAHQHAYVQIDIDFR
jgi:hypothetical protein